MRDKYSRITKILVAAVFLATSFAAIPAIADEDEGSGGEQWKIALGGKLYDNWVKITDAEDPPMSTHPKYPQDIGKIRKASSWRCKECHGWDFKGVDGLYASGKHKTRIKGVTSSVGADPAKIAAILRDDNHMPSDEMIEDEEVEALALFISKGQIDMDKAIDTGTKKVKGGDVAKGMSYYKTICSGCHGLDGKKIKDMPVTVGGISNVNPWGILNKIRNGQPGEKMPAMRAFPLQVSLDILTYAQTLPKE